MKLVAGLGNPGREYARTRHNVGFELIDVLAGRFGWAVGEGEFDRNARSTFDGLAMHGLCGVIGQDGTEMKVLLLKPMTYMNRSGQSIQAAAAFFQIPPEDVLVVLDDLALPCGRLRLRASGSDGGHNGLRDIQRALGTTKYPRLRIGIDPPPPPIAGRDYVLGRFAPEQRPLIDVALKRGADAVMLWLEKDIQAAMNRFNVNPEPPKDEQKNAGNGDRMDKKDPGGRGLIQ